jgi:hypothetical protein
MCATHFGLYLGHPQAHQYKNPRKEGIIKSEGPLGFYYTFLCKIFVLTWLEMA